MAGAPNSSQPHYEVSEPVTPAGSSSRRKEEYEKVMARLSDQSFNPKRYPDPLVARQGIDPQLYPQGVTLEMEKRWLARIKAVKEGSQ
ncbi:hypothetical protein VFPPC_15117 [Pochonia chlamydosporia 170]|uniref:Uncharacterized protein n=1 Tax=Pochonia chlamydosporia 170 TaxID=1380566 RepID=A0A179G4U7_METCM|nr:hypothetical protein VFPPC_15117 [Pochonia chlamydosporia 170]OAQ72381.1 hypothetical protein VFPPC_15117 [Pochonia chlamydosporia 170]